jgi:hypothetical protein
MWSFILAATGNAISQLFGAANKSDSQINKNASYQVPISFWLLAKIWAID